MSGRMCGRTGGRTSRRMSGRMNVLLIAIGDYVNVKPLSPHPEKAIAMKRVVSRLRRRFPRGLIWCFGKGEGGGGGPQTGVVELLARLHQSTKPSSARLVQAQN